MGLRAGEAAGLRLDDIDWRAGEITVRGKGSQHQRLPLPPDVGGALASYLRDGRPAAAQGREAFAGVRAPHRPLTRGRSRRSRPARRSAAGWEPCSRTGCGTPPPPACSAGCLAGRDRPGLAPSADAHDRHLRQGRLRRAARPRAPLAGVMPREQPGREAGGVPRRPPRHGVQDGTAREAARPVRRPSPGTAKQPSPPRTRLRGRRCPPRHGPGGTRSDCPRSAVSPPG